MTLDASEPSAVRPVSDLPSYIRETRTPGRIEVVPWRLEKRLYFRSKEYKPRAVDTLTLGVIMAKQSHIKYKRSSI